MMKIGVLADGDFEPMQRYANPGQQGWRMIHNVTKTRRAVSAALFVVQSQKLMPRQAHVSSFSFSSNVDVVHGPVSCQA